MTMHTDTVDWEAAEQVATRCGARTRMLVAVRDLDELRPWVLMLSRQHSGPAAATYFELAVLVGATNPLPEREVDDEVVDDDDDDDDDDDENYADDEDEEASTT